MKRTRWMSQVLSFALLSCGAGVVPDREIASGAISEQMQPLRKGDLITQQTKIVGSIQFGESLMGTFPARVEGAKDICQIPNVGYTFQGEGGRTLNVWLAIDDPGKIVPELLLYGPRKGDHWPGPLMHGEQAEGCHAGTYWLENVTLPATGTYLIVAYEKAQKVAPFYLTLHSWEFERQPSELASSAIFEGTDYKNDCDYDTECHVTGSSLEVCVHADVTLETPFRLSSGPRGTCGCLDHLCQWYANVWQSKRPWIGDECNPVAAMQVCAEGLSCLHHIGKLVGLPGGATCEKTCTTSKDCTVGLSCTKDPEFPDTKVCRL